MPGDEDRERRLIHPHDRCKNRQRLLRCRFIHSMSLHGCRFDLLYGYSRIIWLLRGELVFDDLLEGLKRLRPEHRKAIDDEGWRAAHTELVGNSRLFLNCLGVLPGIQAFIERCGIQLEVGSKLLEIILVEGALVLAVLAGEELIGYSQNLS